MKRENCVLGLPSETVWMCPYAPEWQDLYLAEEARLYGCIGDYVLDIQHVGSTSIPGLTAKPILDIAISVADFEEARYCIQPIERLGYRYHGEYGIPRRHYFTKGDPMTHHVHMVESQSENWVTMISFRDHLRENSVLAEQYASLKLHLAKQFPRDRPAYQNGKEEFIRQVLSAVCKDPLENSDGIM